MQQPVERDHRCPDVAAHGNGYGVQRLLPPRAYAARQVSRKLVEPTAKNIVIEMKKGSRIRAGLNDQLVRLPHHEQGAVRLYRTSEMNLLSLAVRQIGLPEGRH